MWNPGHKGGSSGNVDLVCNLDQALPAVIGIVMESSELTYDICHRI